VSCGESIRRILAWMRVIYLPSSQGLGQFLQSANDTGTPAASSAACVCSGSSLGLRRTAASRLRRFIESGPEESWCVPTRQLTTQGIKLSAVDGDYRSGSHNSESGSERTPHGTYPTAQPKLDEEKRNEALPLPHGTQASIPNDSTQSVNHLMFDYPHNGAVRATTNQRSKYDPAGLHGVLRSVTPAQSKLGQVTVLVFIFPSIFLPYYALYHVLAKAGSHLPHCHVVVVFSPKLETPGTATCMLWSRNTDSKNKGKNKHASLASSSPIRNKRCNDVVHVRIMSCPSPPPRRSSHEPTD